MKYLLILISLIFLTGCSDNEPKPDVIIKYKTKYILPPKRFMHMYKLEKPISKNKFLKMSASEKELELTIYAIKLFSIIGKYKLQTKSIINWNKKQIQLINKRRKEEDEK